MEENQETYGLPDLPVEEPYSVISGGSSLLEDNGSQASDQELEEDVHLSAPSSPKQPFATMDDFGDCDFMEDAAEVIDDYFSSQVEDLDDHETTLQTEDDKINKLDASHDSTTTTTASVPTSTETQSSDQTKTRSFFATDCCPKKCNSYFKEELVVQTRDAATENDYYCPEHINHLHLILLGQLSALTLEDDVDCRPKTRDSKERERPRTKFMFQGHETCKNFYQFVYNCGEARLRNLRKQLREIGIGPRMHANQGKPPSHTTDIAVVEAFKTFLSNFTDAHALVLPGKMPCYSGDDPSIRVLPSSLTKLEVHRRFMELSPHPMQYRLFCKFWMRFFPNILIQKPRSDLCTECYKNTISLAKLHGLSEVDKLALLKKSEHHLNRVMEERNIYREATKRLDQQRELFRSLPLTFPGNMHYSFDFAQQIFLPYDSQQVGPLYFLAPYKVSLFGVACEPLGKFVLYVIPESVGGVGKGANIVISLFHHFLETFGVGEENIYVHADNCSGQNKNNYLMQYAVWRTIVGLHRKFKISFLPVGHTKFAPDLYFGSVKRAYRRSSVHSLDSFKDMLDRSCGKHVTPFIVANEKGDMNLKIYDWHSFFKNLKAQRIPGLLENYHFQCSAENKGVLSYRKSVSDEERKTHVFPPDSDLTQNDMPIEIQVSGLPLVRKRYLFEKIREFVREDCKEILCPEPQECLQDFDLPVASSSKALRLVPTGTATENEPSDAIPITSSNVPNDTKNRRATRCGYCKQEGHTNRIGKGDIPICPKRYEDEKHKPNEPSN